MVTALFLTLPMLVHAELLEVTVETPGMLSYQISQKTDWKTVTDFGSHNDGSVSNIVDRIIFDDIEIFPIVCFLII